MISLRAPPVREEVTKHIERHVRLNPTTPASAFSSPLLYCPCSPRLGIRPGRNAPQIELFKMQ